MFFSGKIISLDTIMQDRTEGTFNQYCLNSLDLVSYTNLSWSMLSFLVEDAMQNVSVTQLRRVVFGKKKKGDPNTWDSHSQGRVLWQADAILCDNLLSSTFHLMSVDRSRQAKVLFPIARDGSSSVGWLLLEMAALLPPFSCLRSAAWLPPTSFTGWFV